MFSKKKLFTLLFSVILILGLIPSYGFGANFPLEIINIKAAGTGNPAIPATSRIFKAYPGIEYNIRAAVIGGLYPYTFKLTNAPPGMTINSSTGEISWPNPQSNAGPITLTVTDSENTTVSTNWSIAVSTTGFYFVDSSKSTNGTGTISSPFNSIANMVVGTGSDHLNDIVYFRGGTYYLARNGTGGAGQPEMEIYNTAPFTWLGYPGETVNINNNGLRLDMYHIYFDRLNFSNCLNNGIISQSVFDYQTIRRCTFTGLTTNISSNENQGFIYFCTAGTTHGNYTVIQDNEFSNYTGGEAIGSLYTNYKALIEDNYIHDNGGGGPSGINHAIGAKHRMWYLTVRHNKVIMNDSYDYVVVGEGMNSGFTDTSHVEVCFNYFKAASNSNRPVAHQFNAFGYSSQTQPDPGSVYVNGLWWRSLFDLYYYRNTLVGDIAFSSINGNDCSISGPFNIYSNVIINKNTSDTSADPVGFNTRDFISYGSPSTSMGTSPWNCINDSNNLKKLPSDNAVDSNGYLTANYQSYLGAVGWQIQTTQTNTTILSAPTNLRVVVQ